MDNPWTCSMFKRILPHLAKAHSRKALATEYLLDSVG